MKMTPRKRNPYSRSSTGMSVSDERDEDLLGVGQPWEEMEDLFPSLVFDLWELNARRPCQTPHTDTARLRRAKRFAIEARNAMASLNFRRIPDTRTPVVEEVAHFVTRCLQAHERDASLLGEINRRMHDALSEPTFFVQ